MSNVLYYCAISGIQAVCLMSYIIVLLVVSMLHVLYYCAANGIHVQCLIVTVLLVVSILHV